ncbi:3'-5' exonuclease [Streptomyces ipomoeae]|uniref:3'-5' exonuclease n=1 Tax=Streptomyces ipomoeae TaxID=103232 RepID=UPI0029A9A622|nr:3'-5' exonuclease [Streptomyces ipomoeae]MDX2843245.1 3'-5' exonuclease [Streptomyces ipomoeae]
MSTATETAAPGVPASRTSADQDPRRVARGEPVDTEDGVPVYIWGQAPAGLQTKTQLAESRLKLSPGQLPLAYVRHRKHGDFALYDPAAAVKMRPLPSATKKKMEARRTCPECGQVRKHIVWRVCSACMYRAEMARRRKRARTCYGCGTERERPYPKTHGRCRDCRRAQLAEERARKEQAVLYAITCPGRDCSVKTASKAEYRRWREANRGFWERRWCTPCEERDARERAEAVQRAQEAAEAEREARRREVAGLQEWAAAALADPSVVVLDTETTGLDDEACLVEVAVVTAGGDVLLDSLVNPGVPIPSDASEIHGITDETVATAPSFGQLLVDLTRVLDGRRVLIYNRSYDVGRLRWQLTRHYRAAGHEDPAGSAAAWLKAMTWEDVMVPYSDWVGDWHEYFGNYTWQPLNGGHRALGDCRAVLDRLGAMAARAAVPVD